MTYNIICSVCSKIINISNYNKLKPSFPFIRCPKCLNNKFKIKIVKGISKSISCKIICIICKSKISLQFSKVKSLSFPFIRCPKCKKFIFKMIIIKGNKKVFKLNQETKNLYEKYDKSE